MSKKSILSALLISSALLGTTAAHAATSEIKAENKKVTVSTSHAKLYKDSKLKESTTPKNGTVYQVDGYRNINGKHVYRVYQTDKNGKKAYRGYIDSKDTKDLKADKAKGQFVLNGKTNVWKNFYWTAKNTNNAERVVFAKYEYTLGNGQKYYSVYSKDAEGKEVWQGYTSKSNLKEVTSTKESKYVALKKDTKSFANLYFQQTKGNFDVKSGVNFKVTRYYTIDGKKYYSTERAGKTWTGYVDSSVVEDLKAEKVAAADSKVKVAKEWNTYSDHFYTKKAKLADYKGKTLTAKYVYTYGNGKKYASLYDGDTWVGYANVEALDVVAEDKPTNPEKPEVKPDKPTDKPDGNKPGTGGDKPTEPGKPENPDQGGSGSDDTDNKPGQPDQPTESELDKAKKEAKAAIDKAEKELKDAKATNASKEAAKKVIDEAKKTLEGDKLEDIKQIPSKVDQAIKDLQLLASEEETRDLETAISNAKKVEEVQNKLDGVDEVKKALTSAEKVLENAKKGDAGQKEVVAATKAINDAIKKITLKPSENSEEIKKLHAAIEKLKETQKLGADNLVNNQDYQKVLDEAQKVLDDAVKGKVGKESIEAETTKVNDFINKLQLNTEALNKKIDAVKSEGNKVYMTKEQETQFNDFITKAKEAAENTKLSNTNTLKEIDENLKKAEDFIKDQPTAEDVQKLIDATKKEQEVVGQLKGKENDVFENWSTVTEKDTAADTMLEEIKKDQSPSNNTAETKYTAKEVQEAAKALMDSMANLEVNHENLEKYDKAAKDAINDLDEAHKEAAQDLLTSFEVAAQNASVKDLTQMANAAESLNKEIHDDQVQEINDVIKKAQGIEGVTKSKEEGTTAPNAKFYETDSYKNMNNALGAAERAEQALKGETVTSRSKRSTSEVGATQVANGKEAAEKEKDLKEKINALQVKDWEVQEEKDGVIQLTKYKGNYTSTDSKQKDGNALIEIPGSLKDKQVVVESSNGHQLFEANGNGNGKVEVKFETATDGKNPKAGANFSYAFANNKQIGTVDVTQLDTKDATNMEKIFYQDYYLKEIKGSENLVHNKVTTLKSAFVGTNLSTLNTTDWDTSNVTDMKAMFKGSNIKTVKGMENWKTSKVSDFSYMFGGSHITNVDLTHWDMGGATKDKIMSMFFDSKYTPKEKSKGRTDISTVTLPNEFSGHANQAPENVVEALKAAGANGQLAHDVEVKRAGGEEIGTVNTSGKWTGNGKYNKENIITTDSKILNNPVALCNTLMHSEKLNDNETVKDFAKFLNNVAYPVWMYSTGNKVISSRDADYSYLEELQGEPSEYNAGLQHNKSWDDFEKQGSGHYYKAIQLLQEYAQNAKTDKNEEVKKLYQDIVDDMTGMRVVPTKLQEAIKNAEKVNAKAKNDDLAAKIAEAKSIVDGKNSARLNLENWQHIVELTKDLTEFAKTVASK